jgi:hypothetical protein
MASTTIVIAVVPNTSLILLGHFHLQDRILVSVNRLEATAFFWLLEEAHKFLYIDASDTTRAFSSLTVGILTAAELLMALSAARLR